MSVKPRVAESLSRAPIIGVVRTHDHDEAAEVARSFIDAGLELIEITFTVPEATRLVETLRAERGAAGPPWIGMGTVTNADRADRAVAAGTEFIVSPNVSRPVIDCAHENDIYLVVGALTPTEIAEAHELGADLVKVYPLPPVGGPAYLKVVRGPLGDVPMLAAGGFGIEAIPGYRAEGAIAYGIGGPLLGATPEETKERVARALALATGGQGEAGGEPG